MFIHNHMKVMVLFLSGIIVMCTETHPAQTIWDRVDHIPLVVPSGPCDPSGNTKEVPFELSSVPLEDWLKERESRQIPMDVSVGEPRLLMDQQTAVHYVASLHLKAVRSQERTVAFFVGVDRVDGKRLTETSVHAVNVPPELNGNVDIAVRGCVFFRPGNYSLWIAAHDGGNGKHSVARRSVRVPEIKKDPLPLLESRLPEARFPDYTPEETDLRKVVPAGLFAPVSNKTSLAVDVISLTPYSRDGIGLFAQLGLRDSSLSVATLDLEKQAVVYDSRTNGKFDYTEMLQAADRHRLDRSIDLSVLGAHADRAGYLRKFIEQRIKSPDGQFHVMIVLSSPSPMTLPRGADVSPLRLEPDCNCRVYHVRFHPQSKGDDVERILGSTSVPRLEVSSPMEMRKALARIVQDMSGF